MASGDASDEYQRTISLEEIIQGTKTSQPWFAHKLANHIATHYPVHAEAINDAILSSFQVPEISNGFQATLNDASVAVGSILCLTRITEWYHSNSTSPSTMVAAPAAQVLNMSLDAGLFWSLRLLGIPATPDSPTDIPEWTRKDGMRVYALIVDFLWTLVFCTPVPTDTFRRMITRAATLDVLLALWTTLIDGQVPLYACRYNARDPTANTEEWVIAMLYKASKMDGAALAQAVLAARVCDPETFVERTIQRMVTLPKLHTLNHLPHITSTTVENVNVGYIISITETLVALDGHIRTLFTVAHAPQLYVQVVETTINTFRAQIGREILRLSECQKDPTKSVTRMTRALAQMAPYTGALVYWAASAPVSTIALMKAVIENGAGKLLLDCFSILFDLPFVNRFPVDAIWDMMEDYSLHLRVIPALCQCIRTSRFAASKPKAPNSTLARDGRDADVKAVTKRILALGEFTRHRVRLCDNNKHKNAGKVSKEPLKVCVGCHTAVYCSSECQKEDWAVFHKKECGSMARDYLRRKALDTCYTPQNRAFQATIMRHAFESVAQGQDLKPNAVAQSFGRRSVVTVDILRPQNTAVRAVADYASETTPFIPAHLLQRFESFISTFQRTNGTYDGSEKSFARMQSARLVTCGFRLGDEEMRLLLLLKKVGTHSFKGSPSERKRQMAEFRSRGPTARSNFNIEGALVYTIPAKPLPNYAYDSIAGRLLDPYYDDKPEELRKEMPDFLMQMGKLGRNINPGGVAPIAGVRAH